MYVVKVGSNKYQNHLKKRFEVEIEILKEDDIIINVNHIKQGDNLFFEIMIENDPLKFEILKEFIANVLSDIIINYLEIDFLNKILDINCKYLNKVEKNKIIDIALNRLNILRSTNQEVISAKLKRKNRVLLEIIDYIEDGKEIILEGFVRFRLKNYLAELELVIKNAIEEYGVEREYKEFVHLLKYYIDTQEQDKKLVNVIKIKNSQFKLLDNEKNIIENPFLDEHVLGQLEQDLDSEDLLISALITIAPKEVILHFKRPLELVENLKNVFEDRLSICLGCKYCEIKNNKEWEEKI